MAYSIQTAVSDGTLEVLDLSIKYMDKSHIFVYVDDVLVDGSSYSYVWLTDTRIQVVPAVASGSTLKVVRKTLTNEMWHEFSKGARFSTTSMDENFEQLLFLAQEYSEGIYVSDFYTDIDMHLRRILNLGDPVNDGDAVNFKTLKDYLPNADLLPPIMERVAAEESKSAAMSAQGIPLGNKVITGFDATGLQDKAWVHFAGRDVVGDGGGGLLRFLAGSTAAVNGVTVYAVTGGRLVREGYTVFGINVKWAGAKSGVDSTEAIQAACSAGKYILFGDSSDSYLTSGTVTVQSGTKLEFNGASITQLTDQTPIFNADGTTGVEVTGGTFIGKSEASYTNTPSSQAICIKADNAVNLKVWNNIFNNFWYSPLMVSTGGVNVEFFRNKVVGPGAAVLGLDPSRRNTTGVTIIGNGTRIAFNEISETAQGVIIGQGSQDALVFGNYVHDLTNEHGIYCDTGLKRVVISDNIIRYTGANGTGLKVQAYDAFGVQTEGIKITGNMISDTGGDGILLDNTTATPTLRTLGVLISGNNIRRAGAYGVDVRDVEDGYVSDNVVIDAAASGIAWGNCENVKIVDNLVKNSLWSGMRDLSTSNNMTIRSNTIKNCAQSAASSDKYGLLIGAGGVNMIIEDNLVDDANAKMQYGVFLIPNINGTLSLINNTVLRATDCGLRLGSTSPMREYFGNNWNGSLVATFNDPALPVVESASNITLPQTASVISISNTNYITSITPNGHSGRTVTLLFQGALLVTRGANLVLNQSLGSFATSANDTLTLVCDGAYWYEVSRSAN